MPPLHVAAFQLSDDQSGSLMNVSPQSVITLSHPDVKPVTLPSRKRSGADEKFIQQEIASLLKKKLIQPSKSPGEHNYMSYMMRLETRNILLLIIRVLSILTR